MPIKYKLVLYAAVMTVLLDSGAPAQQSNQAVKKNAPPRHERKQKDTAEDGVQIEQFYQTLGAVTVTSTKNAVKIYVTGNHIVIVSRAPKWDVLQYSLNSKKYCEADLLHTKPFLQKTFALFSGNVLGMAPVLPTRSITVCGINATELQSPKSYYAQQLYRRQHKLCDNTSPTLVRLVVSNDATLINPQEGAVACKVLGLPVPPATSLGFPLQCDFKDMDSEGHFMLKTSSVKKTSFPASVFDLPPGYTRVKETAELLADPERDQDLSDFLQERHH